MRKLYDATQSDNRPGGRDRGGVIAITDNQYIMRGNSDVENTQYGGVHGDAFASLCDSIDPNILTRNNLSTINSFQRKGMLSTLLQSSAITARIVADTYPDGKKDFGVSFNSPHDGITQAQYDSFVKFCDDYGTDMFDPNLGFRVSINGTEVSTLKDLEVAMQGKINDKKTTYISDEIIVGTSTR